MKARICSVPVLVPLLLLAALLSLSTRGAAQSVQAVRCADATLDPTSRIQACTAIIQADSSTSMEMAVAYTNRGSALDRNGDYKAAIADFDSALDAQPDYAPAFNDRGCARLSLHHYDDAIADFNQALHISPKSPVYLTNRGGAYLDSGNIDDAGRDFDSAVLLDPANPRIWGSRCLVHVIQADYNDARFDCGHATSLKSDNLEAWLANAVLDLRTGKDEDAERAWNTVLYLAGKASAASGNAAAAISFKPAAFYGRGIAERRRGDLRASKADEAAAVKADPDIRRQFGRWGVGDNDIADTQESPAH